ncbi:unnamed protein product [Cuscuta epithymum]|uniref:Uncharacterized protein n=1 Tax=Cuscuta epithymum TaxID=186058 RepID=A0AAV0EL32_9ASTE|nr:unnamed protein product [Cuscuta epithymum]
MDFNGKSQGANWQEQFGEPKKDSVSDKFSGVEIHFYHTIAARLPPEPPPCEKAICRKFLFSYYFFLHSTLLYFSLIMYGWSILIFEELLIGSSSFSVILGYFLPVFCLESHVVLY